MTYAPWTHLSRRRQKGGSQKWSNRWFCCYTRRCRRPNIYNKWMAFWHELRPAHVHVGVCCESAQRRWRCCSHSFKIMNRERASAYQEFSEIVFPNCWPGGKTPTFGMGGTVRTWRRTTTTGQRGAWAFECSYHRSDDKDSQKESCHVLVMAARVCLEGLQFVFAFLAAWKWFILHVWIHT